MSKALSAPSAICRRRRGPVLEGAILDAAFAELSEVGYTAFSVEGVAARARTGKASIYRRWPTKQELVMDALLTALPDPGDILSPANLSDTVSTADALHAVASAIADALESPAGDAVRSIKCESAADPKLAEMIDERFQGPRRAALLALLQRGIERGEVRPDAATPLIADVLPAVLMHRVILQRQPLDQRAITEIVDQVVVPLLTPR